MSSAFGNQQKQCCWPTPAGPVVRVCIVMLDSPLHALPYGSLTISHETRRSLGFDPLAQSLRCWPISNYGVTHFSQRKKHRPRTSHFSCQADSSDLDPLDVLAEIGVSVMLKWAPIQQCCTDPLRSRRRHCSSLQAGWSYSAMSFAQHRGCAWWKVSFSQRQVSISRCFLSHEILPTIG